MSETPSDTALALIAQGIGNAAREAKETLVNRHAKRIGGCAKVVIESYTEYDDAYQGALLGFLEIIRRFDPNAGYPLFSPRLVIHGASRALRKDRAYVARRAPVEAAPEPVAPSEDGSQDAAEDAARVRQFVESLPEKMQTLVRLVFWSGMSIAEAARAMGISRQAANKMWTKIASRGRRELAGVWYRDVTG